MPRGELPEAARVLPKAGQALWLKTFNEGLDSGLAESEASKEAWAAIKRAGYSKKPNGKWGKVMNYDFDMKEDGTFRFSAPLMKVNIEKRMVEGFATLDNIDESKEIVEPDASEEAFNQWFGNIREMHQKKAVGKAIDWKPDTYTDDEGNTYDGIWVRAKISKGAEDTWQKVLDGTLAGFSIGGATLNKQRDIVKDADGETHQVWRITKYRLTELSLVDNPCNRLATISLIKSVDGITQVEDTVADGDIEKAYNGETGDFVNLEQPLRGVITALETLRDEAVRNNADGVVMQASSLLRDLRFDCRMECDQADYANKSEDGGLNDSKEGENSMEKTDETLPDNENSGTSSVETLSDSEVKSVFRKFIDYVKSGSDEETQKSEDESGTKDEEGETPEMNAEEVTKAIDEKTDELSKSVEAVEGKFGEVGESLKAIATALEKVATSETLEELKKEFAGQLEELAERVAKFETSGAVQKSGDDTGDSETVEKSEDGFWGGNILPEWAK